MMPFLAILRHDLRTLVGSWLVRLWLAATVVLTLLLTAANWNQLPTARLVASLLFPYLVFPWFLVVMVLGVDPVSGSRAEALADGILSRPVTRYEYLLATWAARVVVVLGTYLIVMIPSICVLRLVHRPEGLADTLTLYGIAAAMGVVALVLVFQVSLAFLLGTLLRKPLLTIVVLLVLWYPVNGVLYAFRLEEFSPISLAQAIPTLLGEPSRQAEGQSQVSAKDEPPEASEPQVPEFVYRFLVGAEPPKPKPQPKPEPGWYDRAKYRDFSLIRVVLGYGVPTLLAVTLATLCFCFRDL